VGKKAYIVSMFTVCR